MPSLHAIQMYQILKLVIIRRQKVYTCPYYFYRHGTIKFILQQSGAMQTNAGEQNKVKSIKLELTYESQSMKVKGTFIIKKK